MYKETVKIDSIECTIFYDQDINLPQKQEIDFEFKIEDVPSYQFKNGQINSYVSGKIFEIKSILPIEGNISKSSSFAEIPKFNITFDFLYKLSLFHLENHLKTLELVYNHKLDKESITNILKKKLDDFFYHK